MRSSRCARATLTPAARPAVRAAYSPFRSPASLDPLVGAPPPPFPPPCRPYALYRVCPLFFRACAACACALPRILAREVIVCEWEFTIPVTVSVPRMPIWRHSRAGATTAAASASVCVCVCMWPCHNMALSDSVKVAIYLQQIISELGEDLVKVTTKCWDTEIGHKSDLPWQDQTHRPQASLHP